MFDDKFLCVHGIISHLVDFILKKCLQLIMEIAVKMSVIIVQPGHLGYINNTSIRIVSIGQLSARQLKMTGLFTMLLLTEGGVFN